MGGCRVSENNERSVMHASQPSREHLVSHQGSTFTSAITRERVLHSS